jgi:hypothetical protein
MRLSTSHRAALLAACVLSACAAPQPSPSSEVAQACARVEGLEERDPERAAQAAAMLPGDFAAFRRAAREGRFTVTFRQGNPACLPHLAAGVRSKGHDVLQKTWDASNLSPENARLAGLVSDLFHKPPKGVVVSDPKLTTQDGEPLTCDYDLMDELDERGRRVPGESEQDLAIRAALNRALPDTAGGHRDRVMHGAQAAYGDYLARHPDEKPIDSLFRPEAPLTAVDAGGRIFLLKTVDDALDYYRCTGAGTPPQWERGPAAPPP